MHNSQEIRKLVDRYDREVYARQRIYRKKIEEEIKRINKDCVIRYRNKPNEQREKRRKQDKDKIDKPCGSIYLDICKKQ